MLNESAPTNVHALSGPRAPLARGAGSTVVVCPFPARRLSLDGGGGGVISPSLRADDGGIGMEQLFAWALEPADDAALDLLHERGRDDAELWLRREGGAVGA